MLSDFGLCLMMPDDYLVGAWFVISGCFHTQSPEFIQMQVQNNKKHPVRGNVRLMREVRREWPELYELTGNLNNLHNQPLFMKS